MVVVKENFEKFEKIIEREVSCTISLGIQLLHCC